MVPILSSYVAGAWRKPDDEGVELLDAATGDPVARVSRLGPDAPAVLAHARSVGGPALAELTFTARAVLLKALAEHLNGAKEEFHALSTATGATRRDGVLDIDGGIGVLFSYSSLGRRELPDDTSYVDGAAARLGRHGTFVGQHVYTSLRGAAVQINAFNFPVWGMLEKLAPAFLAGVPTIVKPASQTAYLAELVFRRMVESGLLPDGSVQLVCGSAAGLLDELGGQDLVAFTGSASTATRLRTHPGLVAAATRFTAETDSLNCSILGPDAVAGTPEFDLYVDQVVTEMTVKAGQKCTAIRRALVPRDLVDAVTDAVGDRLAQVRVGNPTDPETAMGPLASLAQRDEVLRSLKALADATTLVSGSTTGPADDLADLPGAFLAPVLLRCDDADRPEPHQVEAFGPVSTVVPYDDVADAVRVAALGEGSLVGSVVTHDRDVARELVRRAAAWHGRLLVLDRDDARESTGHGSPLPALLHGGPGRAGGGQELGGLRAVLHHMQCTAVQGSPDMLTSVTGRWVAGSARAADGVHPFRKYLEDLRVGDTVVAGPRLVTTEDVAHFAEFTGDTFYAHTDEAAARENPFFGGIVAHGYLVLSLAAGLFVDPAPGPVLANYGLDRLRFLAPTRPGDALTVTLTCKQVTPRANEAYGEVRWDTVVANQDGQTVAEYDVLTLVAKRPDSA
jgi:oxepin-CoA hydrolase / 3-oxo-5,6-dehydrosuberyl-CoA semialdehyde dehydrogenase